MTRIHGWLLSALLCAGCAARGPEAPPLAADLAITNVTVVDVERGLLLRDHSVLVRGSRIVAVGESATTDARGATRSVNATGRYLIPGLSDSHVHLSLTGPSVLPLFVANGITSIRDVGSRFSQVDSMRRRMSAGEIVGPDIRTSGPVLEGAAWMQAAYQLAPPEHPIWAGAPRVIVSAANAQHVVDSLKAAGVDLIKARNVWGADFLALADATERAGMPFASHNPNRVYMVDAAARGLDSFEHAESIWGDFDSLSVAARERMFGEVAARGALVVPTLTADVGLVLSADSVLLAAVHDSLGLRDARNRMIPARMRMMWGEAVSQRRKYGGHPAGTSGKITRDVRAMHAAGIVLLAGTDVGGIPIVYPGSSLHEELELLVTESGLSNLDALRTATRNPPRFFGRQDETGTITVGKVADLVLLDADPLSDIRNTRRISGVVLRGRYFDRSALDMLLADAARRAADDR